VGVDNGEQPTALTVAQGDGDVAARRERQVGALLAGAAVDLRPGPVDELEEVAPP
jgi:hypothetical protein